MLCRVTDNAAPVINEVAEIAKPVVEIASPVVELAAPVVEMLPPVIEMVPPVADVATPVAVPVTDSVPVLQVAAPIAAPVASLNDPAPASTIGDERETTAEASQVGDVATVKHATHTGAQNSVRLVVAPVAPGTAGAASWGHIEFAEIVVMETSPVALAEPDLLTFRPMAVGNVGNAPIGTTPAAPVVPAPSGAPGCAGSSGTATGGGSSGPAAALSPAQHHSHSAHAESTLRGTVAALLSRASEPGFSPA